MHKTPIVTGAKRFWSEMITFKHSEGLYTTKKDLVVETIREAIISGRLKPDQKLLQNEIAAQLQMSPTPVREALKQLEVEGLLVYSPHKGVRVANFSLREASEIYRIRGALETLAIRLATPNLDHTRLEKLAELVESMQVLTQQNKLAKLRQANREFHRIISQAAGSHRLYQMLDSLHQQFPWGHLGVVPGRRAQAVKEHQAILESLQRRDAQLAAELMQQHVENAANALASFLGEGISDLDHQDVEEVKT
jgi:DNA-binding GntR family transcriptional regulator